MASYPSPQPAYPQTAGNYPQTAAGAYPQTAYPQTAGAYPQAAGSYPQTAGTYPQAAAAGYNPQYGVAPSAAANLPVTVPMERQLGPLPTRLVCQFCQANVLSQADSKAGILSWIICAVCCIMGCFCGCCLIPFYVKDALDVVHTCPNCSREMGRYKRL